MLWFLAAELGIFFEGIDMSKFRFDLNMFSMGGALDNDEAARQANAALDKTVTLSETKYGPILISAMDYELVKNIPWRVSGSKNKKVFYVGAAACAWRPAIFLHRLILGFPSSMIDHVNGNGLDNTRGNLRFASNSQNQMNRRKTLGECTSIYKGVHRKSRAKVKPWQAYLGHNKIKHNLGRFDTEEEAAAAYDRKAIELFGDFARTNLGKPILHPQPTEEIDVEELKPKECEHVALSRRHDGLMHCNDCGKNLEYRLVEV